MPEREEGDPRLRRQPQGKDVNVALPENHASLAEFFEAAEKFAKAKEARKAQA